MKSDKPRKLHISVKTLRMRYDEREKELRRQRKKNADLQAELAERDAAIAKLAAKCERVMSVLQDLKHKTPDLNSV